MGVTPLEQGWFQSGCGENCGNQGIQTRLWLPEDSKKLSSDSTSSGSCLCGVCMARVTGVWLRQGGRGGHHSMWGLVSNQTAHVSSIAEV